MLALETDNISSPLIVVAVGLVVLFAAVGVNAICIKIIAAVRKPRE